MKQHHGNDQAPANGWAPGQIWTARASWRSLPERATTQIQVANSGDRPIQVGSHFHFFEVNRALLFERARAYGMKLAIPAGTAVRFAPGETKEVTLVEFGGSGEMVGLNDLTQGSRRSESVKQEALARARARGFKGA